MAQRTDSPFRPPPAQSGTRPTTVIAALAVILFVCLLIAQSVVWSRGRQSQAQEDARRSAQQIIGNVAAQGLHNYLPAEPIRRFYLLRQAGRDVGFAASAIQPESSQDGSKLFSGRDILYISGHLHSQSSFTVADNLSQYTYSEIVQPLAESIRHIVRTDLRVADGILEGSYTILTRKVPIGPLEFDVPNAVPPPLRDLFVGLCIQQGDGALIVLPSIERRRQAPGLIHLDQCLIETSSQTVPDDVRTNWPASRMARLTYIRSDRSQLMALDDQHQVVWQSFDSPLADTLLAVPPDELLKAYPRAAELLADLLIDHTDNSQPLEL